MRTKVTISLLFFVLMMFGFVWQVNGTNPITPGSAEALVGNSQLNINNCRNQNTTNITPPPTITQEPEEDTITDGPINDDYRTVYSGEGGKNCCEECSDDCPEPKSLSPENHNDTEPCTKTGSLINNYSLNHHHFATDYKVGHGSSDCFSCGGTSEGGTILHEIGIERIHRYRDVTVEKASFGPGVFMNYDFSLTFFKMSDSSLAADVNDPKELFDRRLTDGKGQDIRDGRFVDGETRAFKELLLLDSLGQLTPDIQQARKAVLHSWKGFVYIFDIFALDQFGYRWGGRVESLQDRKGRKYGIQLIYKEWADSLIEQSPGRQWQLDTIRDPYGRVATFDYHPQQVAGHWVVSAIHLPNGETLTYQYANEKLASVSHPDGTTSNFGYAYNSTTQTLVVDYKDASAKGTHRNKKAYLTNNFQGTANFYRNSSAQLVRLITSNNEVTYLSTPEHRYEGGGKLKVCMGYTFYNSPDYQVQTSNGFSQVDIEATFSQPQYENESQWKKGTPVRGTDLMGYSRDYEYDPDHWPTLNRYSDGPSGTTAGGTFEESSFNIFKQPTRYRDRLGRVTLMEYDSLGNLLRRKVGFREISGNDVAIPSDTATFKWEYYPPGHQNEFLLSAEIDGNGNRTEYEYNARNLLIKKIESPDTIGLPPPETYYTYDTMARLETISDPEGRLTRFSYDKRDRVIKIEYADGSSERTFYGRGIEANLIIKTKDRNGNVNEYAHDDKGRVTKVILAAATMDLNDNETPISDPNVRVEKTYSYLEGTDLISSCIISGEKTEYEYDYRHRLVAKTVHPRAGISLTSRWKYERNQLVETEDPYGRKSFFVYRASDGELIREVQETVPNSILTQAASLPRIPGPNAPYLITDYVLDAEGQIRTTIDPRGIAHTSTYDSRGRLVESVEASSTPDSAKTVMEYDQEGNLIRIQHPRTFTEPGYFFTEFTYTGRNLLRSRTEAAGRAEKATTKYTYYADGRSETVTDARGNNWKTLWHTCCGRFQGSIDPINAGRVSNTDYYGNITHVAVVEDMTAQTNFLDLNGVINEITTRYDARNRPIARTVWLAPIPIPLDPNDPPIAGENGIPDSLGLTTRWIYDENLTDGVGLDAVSGTPSIAQLLSELTSDGIVLSGNQDGTAIAQVDAEGEISVSIRDGIGREVISGIIHPVTYAPITWSSLLHDQVAAPSGPNLYLKTTQIDALDHEESAFSDGAGRAVFQTDAENYLTQAGFDANSNLISLRDPNMVGLNCTYDARNRRISCTDTQGDTESWTYDAHNNLLTTTDAKNQVDSCTYDPRDRKIACRDRIGGVTQWEFDENNNLTKIRDAQLNATAYFYDSRNLQTQESYADGGIRTWQFDEAGRMKVFTDQDSDFVTYIYDQANRLKRREYRANGQSPTSTPADFDQFQYDRISRLISATKGRYANTCNFEYDDAGRKTKESLVVFGNTYSIGSNYDAENRRTQITYPGSIRTITRNYTDRDQLRSIFDGNPLPIFQIHYDPGMRKDSVNWRNGLQETRSYRTGDDLLAGITVAGKPGLSFTYDYDANKNLTRETTGGVMANYSFYASGHDAEDRLTGWSRNNGDTLSWNLSLVGNWDSYTSNGNLELRTHNSVHELTSIGAQTLSYDAKGNQTQNKAGRIYVWDFDNHLVSTDLSGVSTGYFYDALGRRVAKDVIGDTTIFVCDGQQVIAEYGSDFAVGNPDRLFVYAEYVDEPCEMVDRTGVADTAYYYHANRQYSVAGLTDDFGDVVERYAYEPYGEVEVLDGGGMVLSGGSGVENPYLFTGRRLDLETRNYYFRVRYFEWNQGRFLGRDPIGYVDGMNLFIGYFAFYFATDPLGNQAKSTKSKIPKNPDRPIDTTKDIKKYNCGGLAFRTYDFMSLKEVKTKLANCRKIKCSEQCKCGELKCYLWEFDVLLKSSRTKKLVRKHKDFHIVCGKVAGADPTKLGEEPNNTCSKNGPRPISPNASVGSDFKPKPTDVNPPKGYYLELKNMVTTCYCCK